MKNIYAVVSFTLKEMAILMYRILERKDLNSDVVYMKVDAPAVAKKCEPTVYNTSCR